MTHIKMQRVTFGGHSVLVEYDIFRALLAEWSKTMTREEIEQFLIDSWVEEETSSTEPTKLLVDT